MKRVLASIERGVEKTARGFFLLLIGIYRSVVSPFFPPSCRFSPSCSQYAMTAIKRHGALHGGWLAFKRIMRCHPWGGEGLDPVPPKKTSAPPVPDFSIEKKPPAK